MEDPDSFFSILTSEMDSLAPKTLGKVHFGQIEAIPRNRIYAILARNPVFAGLRDEK